jgi:hypothetical protein
LPGPSLIKKLNKSVRCCYHDDPEENPCESGQRLEEPVGDGRLVVGGEGELLGQAVQVLDRLGRNVIKVDLKSSNV